MSRITQRGATGPLSLIANGTFQTSDDSSLDTLLGTRWDLADGREVTLVQAGAVAIVPGKLYQDAAIIANHQNLVVTAYQAYSANGNVPAKVTVTLGGTAVTANQYAGGFVVVNDSNGEGQTLRIASHPAQASTTGDVAITLEDAPTTAITTASNVCLIPPQGADVILVPTTPSSAFRGVGLYDIAIGDYGFVTSKGLTSALAQGAIVVGTPISPSASVSGAFAQTPYSTNLVTGAILGYAVQAGVDTEYRTVAVNIP